MLQQEKFAAITGPSSSIAHICELYIALQSDFSQVLKSAPLTESVPLASLIRDTMRFRCHRYVLVYEYWNLQDQLKTARARFEELSTATTLALAAKQVYLERALAEQFEALDSSYLQKFAALLESYFWWLSSPRSGRETQAFFLQFVEPSRPRYREMQTIARSLAAKLEWDHGWAKEGAEEECRERFHEAFDALEVQFLLGRHDG